jgi:hypothetical protein
LVLNKTFGHSHQVEIYGDDASCLVRCTRFIGAALTDGDAVVVIMSPSHRNSLRQKLESEGCHVAEATEQGRYAAFLLNDQPHAGRFTKVSGDRIATALILHKLRREDPFQWPICAALLHAKG